MFRVKESTPNRSKVAPKTRYQDYRNDLRNDFNCSCGYCDDSDEFQDKSTFHIDHFAPKSKFPKLELVYDNLVYSCRFCNVAKSNKWVMKNHLVSHDGRRGFVDPCSNDYNSHIYRSPKGAILPHTDLGNYMIKELNLGLIRHEYLWKARQLRKKRLKLMQLLEKLPRGSDGREEVLEAIVNLVEQYEKYFTWACR
ncbi:HNH endonuclease [Vibrio fluvialis]|nr:HNH endonuclease [Vibrio fluvialis]